MAEQQKQHRMSPTSAAPNHVLAHMEEIGRNPVCIGHTQADNDGPMCPLWYKNAAISKTEIAFPFSLPFACLIRAVGRLSLLGVCRVGRDACSHLGAVCAERQAGSEKFLPGSSTGSWPTPTLLARIPTLFGLPKGHSSLVTAAFCLGNTSWDVLSPCEQG